MNRPLDLEARFAELARDVGSRPELASAVLERADDPVIQTSPPTPSLLGRIPPVWHWASALAAAVLVALSIWLVSEPDSHSQQMLEALGEVKTVHVTGTTSRVVRHWPLEDPAGAQTAGPVSFEAWYWTDEHGVPRSYETQGPITRTRVGGESREYQQDVDLLYINEGGYTKDRVREFAQLTEYLTALDRPGMAKRDLGARQEGDVTLRGLEVRRRGRAQTVWWNAETLLPSSMSESTFSSAGETVESALSFAYDQSVPAEVTGYQAPKAKHVRHGGSGSNKASDAWRAHVAQIGRKLNEQPLPGRVAVLPRKGGRVFSHSWTLPTPDGKYKVTPTCGRMDDLSTLGHFIRLQVATGGPGRRLASWRVPAELREIVLRHDVVYEADVPWQEWAQPVLNHFGLEYVDVEEQHAVWVAHHDPQSGRPNGAVEPPVPYIVEGEIEKRGLVKPGVGMRLAPVTLETLFRDFNQRQAADFEGDAIIIEDQTGLRQPPPFDKATHGSWDNYWKMVVEPKYPMATDSPYFSGAESIEMARNWYRDEFGITFTAETRPRTIHVVRRKN